MKAFYRHFLSIKVKNNSKHPGDVKSKASPYLLRSKFNNAEWLKEDSISIVSGHFLTRRMTQKTRRCKDLSHKPSNRRLFTIKR